MIALMLLASLASDPVLSFKRATSPRWHAEYVSYYPDPTSRGATDSWESLVVASSFPNRTARVLYNLRGDGTVVWGYADAAFAARKLMRFRRHTEIVAMNRNWRERRELLAILRREK